MSDFLLIQQMEVLCLDVLLSTTYDKWMRLH